MEPINKKVIAIGTTVSAPVEKVWEYWTEPEHIRQWNSASPDWHCPRAENDTSIGGTFSYRMESKDGHEGFDYKGSYDHVRRYETLKCTLDDGRRVWVKFIAEGSQTHINEHFEAEETNSLEVQEQGWQAILDNFKKYVENN